MHDTAKAQDLPRDNASRLAIYDAVCERTRASGAIGVTEDALFECVISRLRVLVPRELHLLGERAYVDEKIAACVDGGIIAISSSSGQKLLTLTGQPPRVVYPDGEVRDYTAGLEPARERLERDNTRLRVASFDVRRIIPSIAYDPDGDEFKSLLISMREHGFMKQFPVVKYDDEVVVDGLARIKAAEVLQLDVEYLKYASDKDRKTAKRRDTPLSRVLIAVHSNAARLPNDILDATYKGVADVTGRAWDETAADLALTQAWRTSTAPDYSPRFKVDMLAFRQGDDPKIQVTTDGKVMVRSLLEAAGLAGYKIGTQLSRYVPLEKARSTQSGGPKADFGRAEDLIAGITTMQTERRAKKLKVDPEWDQILNWLVRTFESGQG